jgi:hypothetical protein
MKLQFRLRTLTIVVTLLAVACWSVHQVILNRDLVAERDDALAAARSAEIALNEVQQSFTDNLNEARAARFNSMLAERKRQVAERRAEDAENLLQLFMPWLSQLIQESPPDAARSSIAFSIAVDPKASIHERIDAAHQVTADEQVKLRAELVKQLPDNLNLWTFNTVNLLGEVGDESTVASLESLRRMPVEIPGKINVAIGAAIDQIRKRHPSAK